MIKSCLLILNEWDDEEQESFKARRSHFSLQLIMSMDHVEADSTLPYQFFLSYVLSSEIRRRVRCQCSKVWHQVMSGVLHWYTHCVFSQRADVSQVVRSILRPFILRSANSFKEIRSMKIPQFTDLLVCQKDDSAYIPTPPSSFCQRSQRSIQEQAVFAAPWSLDRQIWCSASNSKPPKEPLSSSCDSKRSGSHCFRISESRLCRTAQWNRLDWMFLPQATWSALEFVTVWTMLWISFLPITVPK